MNKNESNDYNNDYSEINNDISSDFKDFIKVFLKINNDKELDCYLDDIRKKATIKDVFDISLKEFNLYTKSNIEIELNFSQEHKRLVFLQLKDQIYTSPNLFVPLYCFYAILLYQADHLNEEKVTRICFQNLLGIIMDSCLWNCEPVSINSFQFIINDIGKTGNYLSLAGALSLTSLCFAFLHEMAHYYLHHEDRSPDYKKDEKIEYEADELAYKIFLRIICKNKSGQFDGGLFTDCFQEYTYLSPAMFIGFIHVIKLVDIILYDNIKDKGRDFTETNAKIESFIGRKETIINYLEKSKEDIDTIEGNCLYGGFEESLDSFASSLILTEEKGSLEKYKMGGWERKDEEKVKQILVLKDKTEDEMKYIDLALSMMNIECNPIPQEFIGIQIHKTDPTTGYTSKISNIEVSLPDILELSLISAIHVKMNESLAYLLLFVELIFTLYGKAKRFLSERECIVLLYLKKLIDQGVPNITEEKLKTVIQSEHKDFSDSDFDKAIKILLHLNCISIVDAKLNIKERINIKYDY